jgi:hypothetical protein
MNADSVDEFVIVLEFQTGITGEGIDYEVLQAVVEELREWHPAALFSPDRYALQLHVVAGRPTEALRRALDLHDGAVRAVGVPAMALARIEVLTGTEFESQWDPAGAAPGDGAMSDRVLSNDLYWATRGLLRAASATELTDVLVGFVTGVGGQIERQPPDGLEGRVSIDMSVDDEDSLFAVVDPGSVSGLIVEHSLPRLVADARLVLARRRQSQSVGDEWGQLGLPGRDHWHCSGGTG